MTIEEGFWQEPVQPDVPEVAPAGARGEARTESAERLRQRVESLMEAGEKAPHLALKYPEKVKELISRYMEHEAVVGALEGLKGHHGPSCDHCVLVGMLAADIALDLLESGELTEDEVRKVCTAGLLHDLGKCEIDRELLAKPTKWTDEESREAEIHPRASWEMLGGAAFSDIEGIEDIRKIVIAHHEWRPVHPYPRNRFSEEPQEILDRRAPANPRLQTLEQILVVADTGEALSSSQRDYTGGGKEKSVIEAIMKEELAIEERFQRAALNRVVEKSMRQSAPKVENR
jgi:hypothetical protein